jgi:hypothetical protein
MLRCVTKCRIRDAGTWSADQVDPSRYYFRTNPLFETGAAQYAWMNDIVYVGSGYLGEGGIAYNISQIV